MRLPHPFRWLSNRMHCPHDNVVGIYGDEINHVGGWRKACVDCGALLHGGPPKGERPAGWLHD